MANGMYTALSGVTAALNQLNTMANNLANVNTTAFKQDFVAFSPFEEAMKDATAKQAPPVNQDVSGLESNAFVLAAQTGTYHSQGNLQMTGNLHNIALEGDGFLAFDGPDGTIYSRDGTLSINQDGVICSKDGYPLQGTAGNLTVPADNPLHIDKTGRVFALGGEVGKIRVALFDDPRVLEKKSGNYFQPRTPEVTESTGGEEPQFWQGYLEKSNVNAITSMVSLIKTQRTIEILQKQITTYNKLDEKVITQVGGR